MEKQITITTKQLAKKIGISYATLSLHLCQFEKYRSGQLNHFLFYYNINFLSDLKEFYIKKVKNYHGNLYDKYTKIIENIDKLLTLLKKGKKFKEYMMKIKNQT